MNLFEYQAKDLLQKFGVAVPGSGGVAETPAAAAAAVRALGGRGVLKAQVHVGGRGKAGGIRIAESPEQAESMAGEMLGMLLKTHQAPQGVLVTKLLVEEPITIEREFYAAVLPDRAARCTALMVSAMGGMDIEAVADAHPEAIARVHVDPAEGIHDYHARRACFEAGLPPELMRDLVLFLKRMYAVAHESDATLVEVNPLAVTAGGAIVAADAKLSIDDNALYRHSDLASAAEGSETDPIEAEAHRRGIQYVRLNGTVGIIGNGAGLVMGTLDEVARAGGSAANFLDIGGGAKAELVRNSLEIVLMNPNVRGVLFNIFGGITRGDEVAKGILAARETLDITVPIVVRLAGTRAAEGSELLRGTGLITAATMQEAAARIVELCK